MQLDESLRISSNPILLISPLKRNYLTIIAAFLLIAVIFVGAAYLSLQLAVVGVTAILLFLYRSIANHLSWVVPTFYTVIQPQKMAEATHYAIYDSSRQESERGQNRTYICQATYNNEGIAFFRFRGQLMKSVRGNIQPAVDQDIINLLSINNIDAYKNEGLINQRQQSSRNVFGTQGNYINLSGLALVLRHLREQLNISLLNLLALSAAIVTSPFILGLVIALDLVALILIYLKERQSSQSFRIKFGWLAEKNFKVIRNSLEIVLPFEQILIGDIIHLNCVDQKAARIYFRGFLITPQMQIIVKQAPLYSNTIKNSYRDNQSVLENRLERFIIKPHTSIDRAELKGNDYLLVTDHRVVSGPFKEWYHKPEQEVFADLKEKDWRNGAIFVVVSVILFGLIMVGLMIAHGKGATFSDSLIIQMQIAVISLPSCVMLLFAINSFYIAKKLTDLQVSVLGNTLKKVPSCNFLLMNFSDLVETVNFDILYKLKIFKPTEVDFDLDANTLTSAANQQYKMALAFYISLGYYQEPTSFLRKTFNLFSDRFTFTVDQDQNKKIQYKPKYWTVLKDFELNEGGYRTWLIKFESFYFVLTDGMYKNQISQNKMINLIKDKQDPEKQDNYFNTATNLIEEGKRFRYLLFKKLKSEQVNKNLNQNHEDEQPEEIKYQKFPREELEKDLEFAAFIVFDNAFKVENANAISNISALRTEKNVPILSVAFYSSQLKQILAGFEHLLPNTSFYYESTKDSNEELMTQKMREGGCIVVANRFQDNPILQISDISFECHQDTEGVENLIIPGDYCLGKLDEIENVLQLGAKQSWIRLQAGRTSLLLALTQVAVSVGLSTFGWEIKIENDFLWGLIQLFAFQLLPLALLNFMLVQKAIESKNRHIFTSVLFATQVLMITFTMILLSMAAGDICWSSANGQPSSGLTLRTHNEDLECVNLNLLIGSTCGVLFFVAAYFQLPWQNQMMEFLRFLIVGVWIGVAYLASVPIHLITVAFSLIATLTVLKYFVKWMSKTSQS